MLGAITGALGKVSRQSSRTTAAPSSASSTHAIAGKANAMVWYPVSSRPFMKSAARSRLAPSPE